MKRYEISIEVPQPMKNIKKGSIGRFRHGEGGSAKDVEAKCIYIYRRNGMTKMRWEAFL